MSTSLNQWGREMLEEYATQSPFTDPGRYGHLLDQLPGDIQGLTEAVRNQVVHYRAGGFTFTGDRLAEIDLRWLERRLEADQRRFGAPLATPRPAEQRVAGCCRDFTLLTVAALRQRGVPARSRVGFADYFPLEDWHGDHVIAEYWNGQRWVWVDAQLDPGSDRPPFDPADMPRLAGARIPQRFVTAAEVWTAYRRGEIDADRYGVDPELPFKGHEFVRDEVLWELAHRQRDELLLWDIWGAMLSNLDGQPESGREELVDDVAALLLAADGGDETAERKLAQWYASDPRLHPGEQVRCMSPSGAHTRVDLRTREQLAAV